MYKLSKAGLKLLYKIRHHKGHGIHSPFVFSLINEVIEEKLPYYSYAKISSFLEEQSLSKDPKAKVHRLLFRLINRFRSEKIVEIGTGDGVSALYLTSVSSDLSCWCVGATAEAKNILQNWNPQIKFLETLLDSFAYQPDFVYLNLENIDDRSADFINFLMYLAYTESVMVIDGIRSNSSNSKFWKDIIINEKVTLSLDLFHIGILFFSKRYCKQNFKLSF